MKAGLHGVMPASFFGLLLVALCFGGCGNEETLANGPKTIEEVEAEFPIGMSRRELEQRLEEWGAAYSFVPVEELHGIPLGEAGDERRSLEIDGRYITTLDQDRRRVFVQIDVGHGGISQVEVRSIPRVP